MTYAASIFPWTVATLLFGSSSLDEEEVPRSSEAVGSAPQAFQSSGDISLMAWLPVPSFAGASKVSDCWGHVSASGREYALVALDNATAFVEVTDPDDPVVVSTMMGPPTGVWRTVKVYGNTAYAGAKSGVIQIFDMDAIDGGVVQNMGVITSGGTFGTHTIAVDETSGFLYGLGGPVAQGLRAYDLNGDPNSPLFVGEWQEMFIHDAQVITYTSGPYAGRQIAFCCSATDSTGTDSALRILDVTDKSDIFVRCTATWPNAVYAHQCWLSEDLQYLYLNDELDEWPANGGLPTTTYVFDVSDIDAAFLAGTFDNGNTAIGHNAYVAGQKLFAANYTSGLRVFDLAVDPLDPPEIAWFDTRDVDDLPAIMGLFSNYPFFPSGTVVGSDIESGLFVWWPRAPVLDVKLAAPPPATLAPVGSSLSVTVEETSPGDLVLGTEMLHFNTAGTWQEIPMIDMGGGNYAASFPALGCPGLVSYYVSASSANGVEWTDPPSGAAAPYQATVAVSETVVLHDDFETEQGWTATNLGAVSGDWQRGVPIDDPSVPFDPFSDSDGSGRCWVTGNQPGDSDVDGGSVRLLSRTLDLSGAYPVIQYDYYLYLSDQGGTDALLVEATDGGSWQTIADHQVSGWNAWRTHRVTGADLIQAGVTPGPSVRLRFTATDDSPDSVVEAGLDAFFVKSLECSTGVSYCTAGVSGSGCQAVVSASGVPSATASSGFLLTASSVEGLKDGLFFFGSNGRQAAQWGNGTSYQCVVPPVIRAGTLSASGTLGSCDGSFTQDLNALWCPSCPKPAKNPGAGATVQGQLWYRDPQSTSNQTTSLSDALEWVVGP